MLIRMLRLSNAARNPTLVNCTPWSVLTISGCP
jgi:hypothetical protein